ncbi:MAG: hypothetical protein ACYCYK_00875 [Candidatus Dormibacteria bacterium]
MSEHDRFDRQDHAGAPGFPPDIELDEAARNWVRHHSAAAARPMRQVAADAAITSAIGRAYGQD